MVLLDFSCAFNSVDFDILHDTLRAVNIPFSVIPHFHFLSLLISVSQVISSPYHLYADDLQLFRRGYLNELPVIIDFWNDNLTAIKSWSESFGLVVNPKKSQAIIIRSSRLKSKISWICCLILCTLWVPIVYYDKVRNLGLTADNNITWTSHFNEISKRMHFSYH